jgi:RNA polymerase sigma-70 factor (ECF subfamily)
LVDRARGADPDAWEQLYRRAYPRLLAFAERRIDPDRARDAVAETMARAVAGIGRYRGADTAFDGYLFGILRHVIVDAHRSRAREHLAELPDGPSTAVGPLEHVIHDEEAEAIRAAYARLRPADQELLDLRVIAGLDAEEVAAVLGRRPGAVRMAQARALERLRRELAREQR